MPKKWGYISVAPRYTAGSPAQVPESLALRVARQELDGHTRALSGIYGEKEQQDAVNLGLRGIVYLVTEKGRHIIVQDLITQEIFLVPERHWPLRRPWNQQEKKVQDQYLYRGDDVAKYRAKITVTENAETYS
jgi:hypothetical protein